MNKNQARLWAATAPRADMEDMLLTEWGFSPPVTMTDDQMRTALLSRINNARWRWRSTHIPMGWTPPARTGIANNWPLAVLATAAGLAILLGVAIGAMWLASDPFDDDGTTPAQPTVQPTAAPPTGTPPATATAVPPGSGSPNGDPHDAHFARLESLDPSFRSGGWSAWLAAAGIQCESIRDARQPEEETNSKTGRISVSGLQVVAKNCTVNWPNVVTTDVPSRITTSNATVQYKPDPQNGSVLYTNVVANGEVTIYADAQNWGQFTSKLGFVNGSSPAATAAATQPATAGIKSIDELKSYGDIIQMLSADGYIAGAQVRLTKDFTAPSGFVIQKSGSEVASAKAGDVVSIWVPQNLRVKQ